MSIRLQLYKGAILFLHLLGSIFAQLQVGDISPDFEATVCVNGEDINPDIVNGSVWSLYEESYGKVTWINLFTSW
ncbi:MAG: hypothetical protein VW963_05445 [Candidatus Neomarinimicrobiota bacterium]|tara:strand:+ start:680 stop:904 length:225 start_codon:yes stop_codon:yes gene_type:complete